MFTCHRNRERGGLVQSTGGIRGIFRHNWGPYVFLLYGISGIVILCREKPWVGGGVVCIKLLQHAHEYCDFECLSAGGGGGLYMFINKTINYSLFLMYF